MKNILLVCGSLRTKSFNCALMKEAAVYMKDEAEIKISKSPGVLPQFNPDLEADQTPAEVIEWRNEIGSSDGVIIFSPEYAHDMPGFVKNALDWVVGSGEFANKPVAVINASPNHLGAEKVHNRYLYLLGVLSAKPVPGVSMNIPDITKKIDKDGSISDPTLKNNFEKAMNQFLWEI